MGVGVETKKGRKEGRKVRGWLRGDNWEDTTSQFDFLPSPFKIRTRVPQVAVLSPNATFGNLTLLG